MKKLKRRKQKELARYIIRYSLSKFQVSDIGNIPRLFWRQNCAFALSLLGYKYDCSTNIKTKIK